MAEKFQDYFENIKGKSLRYKKDLKDYKIDGLGTAWSLYIRSHNPNGYDIYHYLGFFSNTFSKDECHLHVALLNRELTFKIKMDDFKLMDNENETTPEAP